MAHSNFGRNEIKLETISYAHTKLNVQTIWLLWVFNFFFSLLTFLKLRNSVTNFILAACMKLLVLSKIRPNIFTKVQILCPSFILFVCFFFLERFHLIFDVFHYKKRVFVRNVFFSNELMPILLSLVVRNIIWPDTHIRNESIICITYKCSTTNHTKFIIGQIIYIFRW